MIEALQAKLAAAGQDHLLAFWDRLDNAGRQRLAAQIEQIDFALLHHLWTEQPHEEDHETRARRAVSPPAIRLNGQRNRYTPAEALARGQTQLRGGKVAMAIVAGGQGSRLGFPYPKGMFAVGPLSGRTLFQILLEQLVAIGRRYGAAIPLYLMTSPATHAETIEFLTQHENFGLPADEVHVFCQGVMPAVDATTDKILLSGPDEIALSPDGHGGMLAALDRSGGLADLERRGIEQLFYCQVDNPLVRVCDPELIGYHCLAESELTTQVVAKTDPAERVGVAVSIDGRVQMVEYSDLPADVASRRLPDGSLELWAGNIAVHVMDIPFLRREADDADALPFHHARKRVPYLDADGRPIEPTSPNAIKYERFIFDLLPAARNALVVECDKATTFAPVKNADGAASDTPAAAKAAMIALHRGWLQAVGVNVADEVPVEINPLWALDAAETAEKAAELVDREITRPTYFSPAGLHAFADV